MAKSTKSRSENGTADVAGALRTIRSKQSREQIRIERLRPFIPVIDEALANGWSWSPILTLIRQHGGPSLTKKDAEDLYRKSKPSSAQGNEVHAPAWTRHIDQSAGVPQSGVATGKEST